MEDDIPNFPVHDFQINEWDYHLYMPEIVSSGHTEYGHVKDKMDELEKIFDKTLYHDQDMRRDKDSSGKDDFAITVENDIPVHDFQINELDYHLYMPEMAQSGHPDHGNNEGIDSDHMSTGSNERNIEKENHLERISGKTLEPVQDVRRDKDSSGVDGFAGGSVEDDIPVHNFQINEWDYHLYMPEIAPFGHTDKDNTNEFEKILDKRRDSPGTLEHGRDVRLDKDSAITVENDIQIHDFQINDSDYHLYMPELSSGHPGSNEGNTEKENDVIVVTSSKTFKCKICDKEFKWAYMLKQHASVVHSIQKTWECYVCHKSFVNRSDLKHHKLLHKGERRFECGVCHKTFPRAQALNVHKRLHSSEGQFKCEVCGEKFNHQSNLCSHRLLHDDMAMFFECSICGKYVRHKKSIIDHIRSVHNMKGDQLKTAMKRSKSALSANVKNNEDALKKIFGKKREAPETLEHGQDVRSDTDSSGMDDFAGAPMEDDIPNIPVHNSQIQSSHNQMDQNLVTSIEDTIPSTPVHDSQISEWDCHPYMPDIAQSALGDPDYVFTDDRIEKGNEDTRLMMTL